MSECVGKSKLCAYVERREEEEEAEEEEAVSRSRIGEKRHERHFSHLSRHKSCLSSRHHLSDSYSGVL